MDRQQNRGSTRRRRPSQTYQSQTSATNVASSRKETLPSYAQDFPSLHVGASHQSAVYTPFLNNEQPTRSSIHEQQFLPPHTMMALGSNSIARGIQPEIPHPQDRYIPVLRTPNVQERVPVPVIQQAASSHQHRIVESRPTTLNTNPVTQPIPAKPNIVASNDPSQPKSRPLTPRESKINHKLCEIILTIHESKEFVCRERVQRELFNFYHVKSWHELQVQASRFNALINLTDRQKDVTFYMHVFEQTFNLCTLNDLDLLLSRFLKVEKYEDLRLGPLDKNPEVQRIFAYNPTDSDKPIPRITTGEVIARFIDFQKAHRNKRTIPFDEFLDDLVKIYQFQSREELGIFCKSFPFLVQVANSVRRDQDWYMQQATQQSLQELVEGVRTRLTELKEKMRDEMELSSFNKKKTPTAVFNYLTSIVDKYLDFLPQRPTLYAVLIQLRDDELLRCLFNVSIYLGTIDQPEVFINELKKLYGYQERSSSTLAPLLMQPPPMLTGNLSKKDRKKMQAMIQQQQQLLASQPSQMLPADQNTVANAPLGTPFNTSSASSLSTSHQNKAKPPPVTLAQLCSTIYTLLARYDTVLSIKQLLKADEHLCSQYAVHHFSAFTYNENDGDDNPPNLVSFLDQYHQLIDPQGELSVYEHATSTDDREDLYLFVQQLSAIQNNEMNADDQQQQQQHAVSVHGHVNSEQLHISAEKLSAIEKAVKHKFHGSIHFRQGKQLIKKAKQRHHKNKYSIVRFEESLLDVNGLNRLHVCPTSLNVDEAQLCQLILHCPLMTDLYTWFQWLYFFQPKFGALKSFLTKHEVEFKDLRLLETSARELFRLPIYTTMETFERELQMMHIRSAVGHLCALILQEGLITRFSFNVYRTSMDAWFRHVRSSAVLQGHQVDPMQCILDFLMYLPVLIGQSRIVEELVLGPLDDVFGSDQKNGVNARTRIWTIANAQQRTKLELWGHIVNIKEWKNESKWLDQEDSEEPSTIKSENKLFQNDDIIQGHRISSASTALESPIDSKVNTPAIVPVIPVEKYTDDENNPSRAAFEHIESIRRGFGVDSGLDSTGQSIVTNLQGMIERSLEKLSNDLYSDQGHFVLELIQNADDNQYPSDCLPTLRFILSPERILVCNNETGFQPDNISAICNVGASTKGKHKQGYAGHKGIGFKSVFMVSHRPEIHSRNYHMRFDTVDGRQQIGYIRPIWLDQYEEVLPNSDEWTTCIRLPIKQETRCDLLQLNFDDIQARLLLFLNRLRQIEIIFQQNMFLTNTITRVFTRIDHAQGQIIELQEKTTNEPVISNFWLVIKKVLEVPAHIKEKLRDVKGEVDSTTIAIAYSLSGIQESSAQLPPTQPVFAYLPLRSYGFRFILQADFEITATRQEIRRDNLWNEWLKLEMTCLLSLAYLQFKRLPDLLTSSSLNTQINAHLSPIQTIKYFLKLIPSGNELDAYFNAFVDESIKLLTGIIELPVSRQNENNETIIDWVLPSKCVIVRDPFIRKILSQDLLISHFNSYYVHEQLVVDCDEQILLKLGCRQLDFSDITRLIEASYKQGEQERPKTAAAVEQIAQWLVCLDYSLQQQRDQMHFDNDHDEKEEKETIAKLKQMKIIPVKQQSRLISVNEFDKHAISFPLDKSIRYSKHLNLVLNDIPTLDEQLLNFIEDKHPRRVDSIKRLLQKLGVNEARNIREIYRQHISPVMSDPARWSLKSESVLMAYLLCIYEYIYLPHREIPENDLKTLRNNMIIKTRDNKFVSLGSSDVVVHLTSKYGCRRSLESLKLSKHQFTFISDDYYTEYRTELLRTDADMHSFVSFLKELNLNDFLQVTPNDRSFTDVFQLADTQWAYMIPQLSELIQELFIIKDYCCEEFDRLVSSSDEGQSADPELCAQLLRYLHDQHRSISMYYSASIFLARTYKHNPTPLQGIESSFCLSLRRHAWIPVVGGKLFKPSDVYLLSSNSQTSAFRRYVPHLDEKKVPLTTTDFIFNILGIKSDVTHRIIFELFMKWSCDLNVESLWSLINETATSDIIPCTLSSTFRQTCLDTIENFYQIYQFLASNDETRTLINRFRLWPLIFVPRDEKTGDFLFVHQTFWNDPLASISTQDAITDSTGRTAIRPHYDNNPALQTFFLDILHVAFEPTIDDYLPLLSNVQDTDKIWQVIERITKLTMEQNQQAEVRDKCLNLAFVPCMAQTQKLMKYTEHPFYPHDLDVANLFADTLPIIQLPTFPISTESKEHFCLIFNIENLGNVIRTKVDVQAEQPSTSLTAFYSRSIDLIQHFLLEHAFISDARSNYLSMIFARMQFMCADRIDLSYCYGANLVKTPATSYSADTYIDQQSGKFYILKKYETSEMRYIDAMTEFIVEDEAVRSKLSGYMKKLLQSYQNNPELGLDQLREKLKQNYEPKWVIPEAIQKDVSIVSVVQEKEKTVAKKPVITAEQIEQIANEPNRRPKPRPKEATTEEDANRLKSFPCGASAVETNDPTKTASKTQTKTKSNESTDEQHARSNLNDQHSHVSKDRAEENSEHVATKNPNPRHTDANGMKKESNNNDDDDTKPSKDRSVPPSGPMVFPDPVSLPPANFERIVVSNLTDLDLFTAASSNDEASSTIPFRPMANEGDRLTGRQGEQFVFQYLQWKYPNETIEWLNEQYESGRPYDIRLTVRSENDRVEYIEVKTTRSYDQNTFPVSIGEVEYLLQHPSNYLIYRVYYADTQDLSTITVINKIMDNFHMKHLKLSMTVASKAT